MRSEAPEPLARLQRAGCGRRALCAGWCVALLFLGSGMTARLAAAAPSASLGEQRLILYRVDFPDVTGAAISSNAAASLILELDGYYRDMSYGQMSFAAVGGGSAVTEVLRLPEPAASYDNQFAKLLAHTRTAATQAGFAPATFDFDVVCTGAKPFLVFGALANVGGPGLWLGNNNFNVGVLGHELGHNLGLPHASAWITSDQSSLGPGQKAEYGDPFDSMGVPGGSRSHFNVRFKHWLGWIPDADAPGVTTNGIYRLVTQDDPRSRGLRALRVTRNRAQDYWIEFRQTFDNRWITNGVTLRWAGHAAENTLLLDTTPGTPSGMQDAPLVVGRTFSDACVDLHITPIGKVGSVPEALDVVVNHGPFPGNRSPEVTVSASAVEVPVGGVTQVSASAFDPDGDAVAYCWDFGDSTVGDNRAGAAHSWPRDGEYVVHCTVSDMKGGTAGASVTIRVGAPTLFQVGGRVWRRGQPVQGALVKVGSRYAYSDSDGAYRITNVRTGSFNPVGVLEGHTLFPSGFINPIAVGPNAKNIDFEALENSVNALTLVPAGSVWRYRADGSSPGTDWRNLDYDDHAWPAGPAKLGYGVGDEQTVLTPAATSRPVTTYFRHAFVVAEPGAFGQLAVGLRRDDGAVVYLNGQELYRENLPAGEIGPETRAMTDVGPGDDAVWFRRLVATRLTTGTNVLAIEIHQSAGPTPDMGFDLELVGLAGAPDQLIPRLSVELEAGNVRLAWPAGYTQWRLFQARALGPTAGWSEVVVSSVPSGADELQRVVIFPGDSGAFFRLRRIDPCDPPSW